MRTDQLPSGGLPLTPLDAALNRLRYEGKVVMLGYHLFDRTRASYTTPEGGRQSKAEWDERMEEIANKHSAKSRC